MATKNSSDPRISMIRLPRALQPLLTEFTGKALPGEDPSTHSVSGRTFLNLGLQSVFATALAGLLHQLVTVPTLTLVALQTPLAVVATALAGSVVYSVRGVIAHHVAGHDNVREEGWRLKWVKAFVEVATSVWLLPAPDAYAETHATLHHGKRLASDVDPDFLGLVARGLRPGRSVEEYRRWFFLESWNLPRFAREIAENAGSHFGEEATTRHRLVFFGVWAALIAAALASGHGAVLAGSFALIRMQAARVNFAQQVSEHGWNRQDPQHQTNDPTLTFNRLVGYELPAATGSAGRDAKNLVAWLLKMLLALPARLGVAAGDLRHHQYHHVNPRNDWANSTFSPVTAKEVWGAVREWNDETFRRLSALPRNLWNHLL